MVEIDATDIRILRGKKKLTAYQWNTKSAKHWFCRIFGIYTHHKKRSVPTGYGINIACLEEFDPFEVAEVPIASGSSMSIVADKI